MKKFKVLITKIPTAKTGYQVNGALVNDISSMGGRDYDKSMSNKPKEESRYLTAVPREEANLEAEDGETAFGDINGDGFPEHKIIKGKRHSQGGVPLNLPDGTFIFSDTNSMKISSCPILKMFNKPCGKKSYTPAELAKPYDINKYRVLLEDPDTDEMTRNTAELMIKKYVIKLGALALAQEAKKGFPQGIPKVAKPYMDSVGLSDEDILPNDPNKQQQEVPNNESDSSEMPDENAQQMQEQPNESAPTQMPDGQPIAQPQEGMMQYGGMRTLRRANEGMEQMPEEEMMQPQQPQQESGDQMQQVIQQVGQALQQGAKPQEIVSNLLENRMPPQEVMQIFVNLGVPEDKAEQLVMSVVQQMQSKQQQGPMAMYGMSLGGYEMPDYMQYGGLYKADDGVTVNGIKAERRNMSPSENSGYQKGTVSGAGPDAQGYYRNIPGKARQGNSQEITNKGNPANFNRGKWEGVLCDEIKQGSTVDDILKRHYSGQQKYKAQVEKMFADCFKQADEIFTDKKDAFYNEEETPEDAPCYCENAEGKLITKDGQPIELGRDAEGNCIKDDPKCHEEPTTDGGGYNYQYQQYDQPIGMDWSQQDMNLSNNMEREKHKKYGPTYNTLASPEYEPVYDNWLGEIQRDLAQSNANAQLLAKNPQNRALLTQINNSTDAIEKTNKENVGTENQARLTNFQQAVNNYSNLNTAKKTFNAEGSFANQEFDNETNDWNYRKTLQQNSGDKNMVDRWNLQTEEFALDPRYGYKRLKNSGKKIKPEENLSTLDKLSRAKASGLYPGIDDKTLLAAINSDELSKLGGSIYARGGYVYGNSIYPFND